jgi:hypothetical protein
MGEQNGYSTDRSSNMLVELWAQNHWAAISTATVRHVVDNHYKVTIPVIAGRTLAFFANTKLRLDGAVASSVVATSASPGVLNSVVVFDVLL